MGGGGRPDTGRDSQLGAVYNGADRPVRGGKEGRRAAGQLIPQFRSYEVHVDTNSHQSLDTQAKYEKWE